MSRISNQELQTTSRRGVRARPRQPAAGVRRRARNAELWDVEGRRYIDFGSGIAVLNTGHLHPEGAGGSRAASSKRFSHTCLMVTPVRVGRAARREAQRAGARPNAKENDFRYDWRRGRREHDQDRTSPHGAQLA